MRLLVLIPVVLFACGGDPPPEDPDTAFGDTPAETATPDADDVADTTPPDTRLEVDEDTSVDPTDSGDTAQPLDAVDALDTSEPLDTGETPDADDAADTTPTDTAPELPDTPTIDAADTTLIDTSDTAIVTTCPGSIVIETHPVIPSPYVPVCSEVDYATDPPTSGPHYPVWATYKTYLEPVNPGFLVHSLKHGAIVITWRCDNGCAEDLTALRELINGRAQDPRCDALLYHRIVVAPRPDQDHTLVASAWGHSFKADCFDLPALTAFIDAHYGQGLEDDCFEGVDVEKIRPDNPWYCPP